MQLFSDIGKIWRGKVSISRQLKGVTVIVFTLTANISPWFSALVSCVRAGCVISKLTVKEVTITLTRRLSLLRAVTNRGRAGNSFVSLV